MQLRQHAVAQEAQTDLGERRPELAVTQRDVVPGATRRHVVPADARRDVDFAARPGRSPGGEVLQPRVPVRRMVFHEITRDAIRAAGGALHARDVASRDSTKASGPGVGSGRSRSSSGYGVSPSDTRHSRSVRVIEPMMVIRYIPASLNHDAVVAEW